MMTVIVPLLGVVFLLSVYFWWGFSCLPAEKWQIVAAVPSSRTEQGHWQGINYTWYGLLTANAYLSRCAPITRADINVEAVLPKPDEAQALQIGADQPCLLLKRRTWNEDRVVTVVFALHPGSRFELTNGQGAQPG